MSTHSLAYSQVPVCDTWSIRDRFDRFWGLGGSLNTAVVTRAWFHVMPLSTFSFKKSSSRKGLELPKTLQCKKGFWKQMAHSKGERDSPEISKYLRQSGLMPKIAFIPHKIRK